MTAQLKDALKNGVGVFARRFRREVSSDGEEYFGWLEDGTVDLLLLHDPKAKVSIAGRAQAHEGRIEILSTIITGVPINARLKLSRLVNAAGAGGGKEIPITGFPGFFGR